MQIFPFDKTTEDVFKPEDITAIQADGISIRSGNRIIRLSVTSETVVDDNEQVRKELVDKYNKSFEALKVQFEQYKEQMKMTLDKEKKKLQQSQAELDRRMNAVSVLPAITEDHLNQGLSVAVGRSGGLIWSFKTVYAPKMVGNRRIEPDYAKRLITPVVIDVRTDMNNKVHDVTVRQYIGGKKFYHYHSLGSDRDCWGQFKYAGRIINNPDDMIAFCKEASFLLEVVNDMSIGTRNPKGLSRFDTLCKHLLAPEAGAPEGNVRSNASTSRNERTGVTTDTNQVVSDMVWTT
jgi:hypothetical protein